MDIDDLKEVINNEIDNMTWWYQNCRKNRLTKAECCKECPFRIIIEIVEDER